MRLLDVGTKVRVTIPLTARLPDEPETIEGEVKRSYLEQVYNPPETALVVLPDGSEYEVDQHWCTIIQPSSCPQGWDHL